MTNREGVITHLDDLRLFADVTVHPVVSPGNWDVYSSLCDYIDQIKTEVEILLKEQEAVVRCKDCRKNMMCEMTIHKPKDWFCADGERRWRNDNQANG